jgi:phage head maturation protease
VCRVDDPEAARMPAFSVCFTPETYELIDCGGRNFHFRVTSARLDEVSLTENPALRSALVQARAPALVNDFVDPRYRALANKIARLKLAAAA